MRTTGKRKTPHTDKPPKPRQPTAKTRTSPNSRPLAEQEVVERVRGLKFLYDVANITGAPDIALNERYQEIANLLPRAWHHPEIACARIIINDREFRTDNYRETRWRQSSEIILRGKRVGSIEVGYLEERPERDEGPFLKEERLLLDSVAERLETITEHRQAEAALRESEEFNSSLLENAPNAIIVFNPDMSIRYTNPAFKKLTGFAPAEITGIKPPFPWWRKEAEAEFATAAELKNDLDSGHIARERFYRRKNGEDLWVEINAALINPGGVLKYYLINWVDITERKQAEAALRESEEFSTSLMENSAVPILVVNDDTSMKYVNPAFEKLTGFKAKEVIGRKAPYPWWVENVASGRLDELKKDIHTGVSGLEKLFWKKNGERFWVAINSVPVKSDGVFQYSLENWLDITERKRAEEKLRESEEKYRAIFEQASDSIVLIDTDTAKILDFNDQAHRNLGYSREEFANLRLYDIDVMESAEDIKKHSEKAQKEGADTFETKHRAKNGELRDILVNARTFKVDEKKINMSVWHDITDRKRAEEHLRTISHSSPLGIYILQDGRLQYTNPHFQKLTGYSERELEGRELLSVVSAADSDVIRSSTISTIKEARPYPCEYRIINKAGQIKWVMQTVSSIQYQGRDAILGNVMDITERKYLERKVIEYEELSKVKSSLLATVSHELRTPLAIIKGYSTMILDYFSRLDPAEHREYLRSIDHSTDRLTTLVDNLLDSSRMEAGLLKLEKTPTAISKLIRQAWAEACVRSDRHHIVIRLGKNLPVLNIDAKRIRQVLDNLIDNAIKYSPEGREVVISARRDDNSLIVSIADEGPGIPQDELVRVFDRMYRIEQRLSFSADGMGLGLSICRRLIEAHGGRIWAENNSDKGSVFSFILPLTTARQREKIPENRAGTSLGLF